MWNATITLALACLLIATSVPFASAEESEEAKAMAILKSDASRQEKMNACLALSIHGGKESIPMLAALLEDEELSHMARYALEPLPYSEASDALRNALGKTSDSLKIGIISSLAVRREPRAVPDLIVLLHDESEAIVYETARALGTIATPEAGKALQKALARTDISQAHCRGICDGLFRYAEALCEQGQGQLAAAVYDRLLEVATEEEQIRTAALRGAVLVRGGEEGVSVLVNALRGEAPAIFSTALRISKELGQSQDITDALVKVLPALSPERKILLMQALDPRGGDAAGPALITEASEGSLEARKAALATLTRMGHLPALKLMSDIACSEDKDLAKAAQDSLCYFPGQEREDTIKAMLQDSKVQSRRIAIELIGRGGLAEPVEILMHTVRNDTDEEVRIAALKSLYHRAGREQLQELLNHVLATQSEAEIQAGEKTLGALCAREKKMAASDVVIQKAVYGAFPDGPFADVTDMVSQIVKSGSLSVHASNALCGDPAPNIVKALRVDYNESGTNLSKTVIEGESLSLTSSISPPEIVDSFYAAFETAQIMKRTPSAQALLRLLGATGSPKALALVLQSIQTEDEIQETALRVLCDWPTTEALPTVMDLARETLDPTLKTLAFRGAVRMIKQSKMEEKDCIERYTALIYHADRSDQKRLVLSGLAQMEDADALEQAFRLFENDEVKSEAVQAAISIAKTLGKEAREDPTFANVKDLDGWKSNTEYWSFEDQAIVGHSDKKIPSSDYLWSSVEVTDFYLAIQVKLDPPTANSGIQFRSKKIQDSEQALGYQGDIGQGVWGRLYHQGGRGKLDWNGRAEEAVQAEEWNLYEILAVGPAIWTAINGKLGIACLDTQAQDERTGGIAFQIHAGPPQTVRFRVEKLVHDPKVELAGRTAEDLILELKSP